MKIPKLNKLELITTQQLVTTNAITLSLYGLDPYISNKDIPNDISDELNALRTAILSNIRAINLEEFHYFTIRTNTEVNSDVVFGCAYQYIKDETPEIISIRIKKALDNIYKEYKKDGKWKKYFKSFGGQALVDKTTNENKKGQGSYRKNDEIKGTFKLIGLLICLLQEKNKNENDTSKNYGKTIGNPIISHIYNDIFQIAKDEKIDLSGVGSSTFSQKIKDALFELKDE